jgi:hypothetical protein
LVFWSQLANFIAICKLAIFDKVTDWNGIICYANYMELELLRPRPLCQTDKDSIIMNCNSIIF